MAVDKKCVVSINPTCVWNENQKKQLTEKIFPVIVDNILKILDLKLTDSFDFDFEYDGIPYKLSFYRVLPDKKEKIVKSN